MLWGRAAARCAFPECRTQLYVDETETDDAALIGENCHIVGSSEDGPRGDNPLPASSRDKYGNLILLCRNHHRVVDQQPGKYTVEFLHSLKEEHERWVIGALTPDLNRRRDDEHYAGIVDRWVELAHVQRWIDWSSYVLSNDQPRLLKKILDDLDQLSTWLVGRVWPHVYPKLEEAFVNFQAVLNDFRLTFHEYADLTGGEVYFTRKFYQIEEWDEEKYDRLSRKYEKHVALVQDLMLELSRAANLICDLVRQFVAPSFFLREGRLMCQSGPHLDLTFHTFVVEYSAQERDCSRPYPGLGDFQDHVRFTRDVFFGRKSAKVDG